MNILRLIEYSYREATRTLVMGTSAAMLERARRRVLVKALAGQLRQHYAEPEWRVFHQFGRGNAPDFGAETLLYDISVCQVAGGATAARSPEDFLFIAAVAWQIEVEFSRDWRRAIYAINRLNCGSAARKLLVAAEAGRMNDGLLETARAPYAAGCGERCLALIPRPADWGETDAMPRVWRLDGGAWTELEPSG